MLKVWLILEVKKRSTFREVGDKTGVGPLGLVVEPGNGCAHVATGFYVSVFYNEFVVVIVWCRFLFVLHHGYIIADKCVQSLRNL